jgi:hypothetical protein
VDPPGPGDAWAGGTVHALTLPLGRRPLRPLVLYIDVDDPRALQPPPSLVRREAAVRPEPSAAPARLVVTVNRTSVATLDPRAGSRRPPAGADPDTRRRHRIEIPARALGDGSSVRLSLANRSGPGIALERLRLVEATPTFGWSHWRRRGRFPPESAVFLAASLEACGREGITCVDLRSTFAAYPDYLTLTASRLDPHPSALAHRLAADRLMEAWGAFWLQARPRAG